MRVRREEIQREKLSKWSIRLAVISFAPVIGIAAGVFTLFLSAAGLYLGRKYPERFGGVWRLRLSILLATAALTCSFFEMDAFFRYKFRQAEQARSELTMMRLYEVTEIMENYCQSHGEYPAGSGFEEIVKAMGQKEAVFFPSADGWGRPLVIKSQPWDYSVTAHKPPAGMSNDFPVLKAQSPKPVFPFVGLYPGAVVEPAQEQAGPFLPEMTGPPPGSKAEERPTQITN